MNTQVNFKYVFFTDFNDSQCAIDVAAPPNKPHWIWCSASAPAGANPDISQMRVDWEDLQRAIDPECDLIVADGVSRSVFAVAQLAAGICKLGIEEFYHAAYHTKWWNID
jgi:hypothetical protein